MAMPRDERNARNGRVRRPTAPTLRTSRGHRRAGVSRLVVTPAPPRAAAPSPRRSCRRASAPGAAALRDLMVVGDDHDRRALGVAARAADPSPLRRTTESSAPVGSSASSRAGSPATARAIATRCFSPPDSSCGSCSSRCPRPTRSSADGGPSPALRLAQTRVEQAVRHVVQRRVPRRRGGTAGTRSRCVRLAAPTDSVGQLGDVVAVDPYRARPSAGRAYRRRAASWTCPSRTGRRSRRVRRGGCAARRPPSARHPTGIDLGDVLQRDHFGIPTTVPSRDPVAGDLDLAVGEQPGLDRARTSTCRP